MIDKALNDMRVLYQGGASRTGYRGAIREEDVLLWSAEGGLSVESTFDQIAVALARAYIDGSLDWDFCDSAANGLYGVLLRFYADPARHVEEPRLFWQFYLAFDYSETVGVEKSDEAAHIGINEFLKEVSGIA